MRRAIIFLIMLTVNFSVKAECGRSGIKVWPIQQNIATNPIFVIEGYDKSQEVISVLNIKNKIYLKCNAEIIPINVIKILKSKFYLTQAILKPESELIKGKTYDLIIDNLSVFEKGEYVVTSWTVNSANDNKKPVWSCLPTYKSQRFIAFGCGPEKYVNFCGDFKDDSPTLVYAKVFNKKNKTSSDYFITSEDKKNLNWTWNVQWRVFI